MSSTSQRDEPNSPEPEVRAALPVGTVVTVAALVVAGWIAAGSLGLLSHPLRHALTWIALAVAIVAGESGRSRCVMCWLTLAGAVVASLLMTASSLPAVNVLAVALVAAVLVRSPSSLHGRAVLIAALAAAVLGVFRLACGSIPTVWMAADALGCALGRLGGAITGEPLWVGASFAGVDFLVVMAALYAGWLALTLPPRRSKAIYAAAAIMLGHLIYLAVLAYSNRLLAALPEPPPPELTDINYVGRWSWAGAAGSLLPWSVPVLSAVIHGTIVVLMFRWAAWPPVAEPESEAAEKPEKPEKNEPQPRKWAAAWPWLGPVLLAAMVPVLTVLSPGSSTLDEKLIVAYQEGHARWTRPEHLGEAPEDDQTASSQQAAGAFGALPWFVESLGGRFLLSPDLSQQDLDGADVLLLLHPDRPWTEETLQRIRAFVEGGGSLLVAAGPAVHRHTPDGTLHSSFNDVLDALGVAMRVRRDTAASVVPRWEHSLEEPAHPATLGIDDRRNRFGLVQASSIDLRWPARPMLLGRFGWSDPGSGAGGVGTAQYDAGEKLGDLVLAAEQRVGRGKVVVLGNTSCLENDVIANSYPFAGRLLSYLADGVLSPQSWWRQLLGLLAAGTLIGLLAWRPAAMRIAAALVVLAVSLVVCVAVSHATGRVLPDGTRISPDHVACIDASHLEAYSSETWDNFGIGGLARTLIRNGYLPLLLPELTPERLEGTELLISIGPGRRFSSAERATLQDYVDSGGALIFMAGAEHVGPHAKLLEDFGFHVAPSPVPPTEIVREPEPLGMGAFRTLYINQPDLKALMLSYASWEVTCTESDGWKMAQWSDGVTDVPFIVSRPVGRGAVAVVGDTYLATNQNLELPGGRVAENIVFWRWFLSRVTGRQPWTPPKQQPAEAPPADDSASAEGVP